MAGPAAALIWAIRPGGAGDLTLPDGEDRSDAIAWCRRDTAPYKTSTLVAGDEFNLLAADDMLMATPAVARDRLLVRTEGLVYCLQHR